MLPLGDDAFARAVNAGLQASAASGRWNQIYDRCS